MRTLLDQACDEKEANCDALLRCPATMTAGWFVFSALWRGPGAVPVEATEQHGTAFEAALIAH